MHPVVDLVPSLLGQEKPALMGIFLISWRGNLFFKYLLKELSIVIKERLFEDDKSNFQKVAQEKRGITPTYKVVEEYGPDHDKRFTVGVFLNKELIAKGEGSSKQEAEEAAANKALKNWK